MDRMIEVLSRPDYPTKVYEHVTLSALAILLAVLIAVPVALAVSRSSFGSAVAINVGNVGRAVPSLAILAFALPLLGLGFLPSLFALTVLGIPPILINASTGLRQVEPRVIDAAKGMGLSEFQVLMSIQLPIAAPVIFAGIRTAAVQVVASATLATFIGGGTLGELIVEGFQRGDYYIMLAGAFSVAILAIITEVGFGGLEKAFTPKGLRIAQKRRSKR